jgi:predicted xylose isomerase-like sugar epimerase
MSQTKACKHNEPMIEKKKIEHIVEPLRFAAGDFRLRVWRRNFFARMKITSVGKK